MLRKDDVLSRSLNADLHAVGYTKATTLRRLILRLELTEKYHANRKHPPSRPDCWLMRHGHQHLRAHPSMRQTIPADGPLDGASRLCALGSSGSLHGCRYRYSHRDSRLGCRAVAACYPENQGSGHGGLLWSLFDRHGLHLGGACFLVALARRAKRHLCLFLHGRP